MKRFKVGYQPCNHCDRGKSTGYLHEHELKKKFICGNCQIGECKVIVLEEFEV